MSAQILVLGATGNAGGATLRALEAAGAEAIAFVRDPAAAERKLGDGTPMRVGDLSDEASLRGALAGVDAVLLCSGNAPAMRDLQLNAVRVISSSDVRRIVKISGSPVSVSPQSPARTGRDHCAVEEAMRAIGRETVAIRPNMFMQAFIDQAQAVSHGALPGLDGEPRVSFIDARDIGRVAAAALMADTAPEPVLEVTGPQALTWFDVADAMSAVFGRTITHYPMASDSVRQALLSMGRPEWLVNHLLEIGELMREPKAAEVTDTVERITGHPPGTFTQFLTDNAAAFPAA